MQSIPVSENTFVVCTSRWHRDAIYHSPSPNIRKCMSSEKVWSISQHLRFLKHPSMAEAISECHRFLRYCDIDDSLISSHIRKYVLKLRLQRHRVIPSDPLEVPGFTDPKTSATKRIPPLQVLIHSRVRSHHASVLPFASGRYSHGFQLCLLGRSPRNPDPKIILICMYELACKQVHPVLKSI